MDGRDVVMMCCIVCVSVCCVGCVGCGTATPTASSSTTTSTTTTTTTTSRCVVSNTSTDWYDGIAGIQVLSPEDQMDWQTLYNNMHDAQWSEERHAILLKAGDYPTADVGVGYYTSIMGVGKTRQDVIVNSVYSRDSFGHSTNNFWRSVEGLTVRADSMWSTSQACPMRRMALEGSLRLSDVGFSSGGFVADTHINGGVACGSQQQFFFRNAEFGSGVDGCRDLWNGAFVGTVNEGDTTSAFATKLENVERMAEKPFLVEESGQWHIAVPNYRTSSKGTSDDTDVMQIPIDNCNVHVAKDGDSAASINAAIQGKRGLLLTPGFYALEEAIRVTDPNFVVLGIGFPTLVPNGGSALVIEESATEVRVASILIDAGMPVGEAEAPALLHWKGTGGVLSDIFTRVGAFKYQRGSKGSCNLTKADVNVQLDGDNLIVDNTWFWHADHDDCTTAGHLGATPLLAPVPSRSDSCDSGYGLLVQGSGISAFGLKVEHVHKDHVYWKGENGKVIFLQEELPYHTPSFGSDGNVGYRVDPAVTAHTAYALGVYIITDLRNVTAISAPDTASLNNMVAWDCNHDTTAFTALLCHGGDCTKGQCDGDFCRLQNVSDSHAGEILMV